MTDHKFTDDEVIKALECCAIKENCTECFLNWCDLGECEKNLARHTLALINRLQSEKGMLEMLLEEKHEESNRQKVEIERLRKYYFTHDYHECHNEAIKEFASRLRKRAYMPFIFAERIGLWVAIEDINEIEQELTEVSNG